MQACSYTGELPSFLEFVGPIGFNSRDCEFVRSLANSSDFVSSLVNSSNIYVTCPSCRQGNRYKS